MISWLHHLSANQSSFWLRELKAEGRSCANPFSQARALIVSQPVQLGRADHWSNLSPTNNTICTLLLHRYIRYFKRDIGTAIHQQFLRDQHVTWYLCAEYISMRSVEANYQYLALCWQKYTSAALKEILWPFKYWSWGSLTPSVLNWSAAIDLSVTLVNPINKPRCYALLCILIYRIESFSCYSHSSTVCHPIFM